MLCLVGNDTLVKLLGPSMPLPQLVFVRGCVAVLMLYAVARASGATTRLHLLADRRIAVRALADAIGTLMFLASLMHLPLGNANAIMLAGPLVMAVFAVVFLRERPPWQRWLAIATGFVGVLLVVQPSAQGFNTWGLLCLSSTLFHATRELLTRRIDAAVPSILVALTSVAGVTLLAAVALPLYGWQPMGWRTLAGILLAAALLASGYYLIVLSMRHGEMTVVAPFRYAGLLAALLIGHIVWGDVPNALAWAGIGMLLAAGLALLHNGHRPRATTATAPMS